MGHVDITPKMLDVGNQTRGKPNVDAREEGHIKAMHVIGHARMVVEVHSWTTIVLNLVWQASDTLRAIVGLYRAMNYCPMHKIQLSRNLQE